LLLLPTILFLYKKMEILEARGGSVVTLHHFTSGVVLVHR